ncbi:MULTISPECIES: LuxR C-terminal-related transcriptional regulator [unclassified Mycobacterium]|uniref:LuxR C-terminal-related transcriptional regulator n=1 Tax=unclassified Mycobacterium TaxID=2642494 RepID=UPI0029C89AC3|nr:MULTISPECIES: LuxR C-terminal-related transcriptional regulator [unclassified Mycobacterium]
MAHRNVTGGAGGPAVDDLLDAASVGPAGLIIEGDPGIGKTTLWVEAIDRARERGFAVLSSRPAQTESVLAYACLADLLNSVDPELWADLPRPQRHAVDRVLLRSDGDEAATDRRAVAAAFLAVIEALARRTVVLLGIDDLQWVDLSSVHVLTFAARRATGRIGVLGAVRTSKDASPASWLQLPRPEQLRRITLPPLSLGAIQAMVADRLGRSFPRPTMVRIYQTSGGNPFYALELARSIHGNPAPGAEILPGSLNELVEARIGAVDTATGAALLAASCLAAPTIELVADAVSTDPQLLVGLLEVVEGQGIIRLDGTHIRFTHPLLERGVYSRASAADRRATHRRLAEVVEEPELQARHLALAATSADPTTLRALDAAAEIARRRGAPEASAELVSLGVRLGGETPERQIRLASYHFSAGDAEQARALLEKTVDRTAAGPLRAGALYLLGVVRMFDDNFIEAAELLERALDEAEDNLALRVQTLVTLSFAHFNSGQLGSAIESVERAVPDAERLGLPDLLGQALSMRVMLRFFHGDGFDEPGMDRALALEDLDVLVPSAFRPSVQRALLLACIGQLDVAHDEMSAMRRRYLERGDESGLLFIDFHAVLLEIWRGDFGEATLVAESLVERTRQLGGDFPLCVGLTARAALAAYAGRVDQARSDATEALAAGRRTHSHLLSHWPVTVLGFLDVSLCNYEAALVTLQPQLSRLEAAPDGTEIIGASFVPDAVEAMISLGQLAEVAPLIERFERNARRLDRPWMLAIGARCRSMLLATGADIDGAVRAAEEAMVQHDRVPMPFERARTQLLLGQLQRRQRRQDAASTTLTDALDTFERLGTPVWAERARAQLARTNVGPRDGAALTPSEQRVAELAASGMTNRDMASALFISPKTVEANLSRVYRKLEIHSRAELGRRMRDITG